MLDTYLVSNIVEEIYQYVNWYDLYWAYKNGSKIAGSNKYWKPIYSRYFPNNHVENNFFHKFIPTLLQKLHLLYRRWNYRYLNYQWTSVSKKMIKLINYDPVSLFHFLFLYDLLTDFSVAYILHIQEYINPNIRNNRGEVLAATRKNWKAMFLYREFLDDKEIAMIAVQQYGDALLYISSRFQDDNDVVCAAVQQNPKALHHASERLRENKEIVLLAMQQDKKALTYASEELLNDDELITLFHSN